MKKKNFYIFLKDRPTLALVVGTKADYAVGQLVITDGSEVVASFNGQEVQGWKCEDVASN